MGLHPRPPARPRRRRREGITGRWDNNDSQRMADRMQQKIEHAAPGFTDRILARRILAPPDLQNRDANLVGGALNGGTAALHQQLIFRPIPGLGRAEPPSTGCIWDPRPPTPAAVYTAPAARTPPEPRSLTIGSAGLHGDGFTFAPNTTLAEKRQFTTRKRIGVSDGCYR